MSRKLDSWKRLILLIVPLIASSAIATRRSLAATFALSVAEFKIENFTVAPLQIYTMTETETSTFASNSQVTATAFADAAFLTNLCLPCAILPQSYNFSLSTAQGTGNDYFGFAQSSAAIIGYNFLVGNNENDQIFSFNFNSMLELNATVNNPLMETATAAAMISFQLFDSSNNILLDSLTISNHVKTSDLGNYFTYQGSDNIAFINNSQSMYSIKKQTITNNLIGNYSQIFSNPTALTLLEIKTNEVNVQAPVKTPNHSTKLDLLILGLLGIGLRFKLK